MTLAALSSTAGVPGYSTELLSDAETLTSEVRHGGVVTADGSEKAGACVGHHGDGHCR
jgi:hypothetical protein